MKFKDKNNLFVLLNVLLLFFSFLLISYFVPLTGDDWTNANFNTINILKYFSIAFGKYFTHEGRFISRIFVLLFTNVKWLWNIVSPFVISLVYYLLMKIIKPKHLKLISVLLIISMVFLETTCFNQTYLWVTGNITYYLPMFLFILYIYLIRDLFDDIFVFNKKIIVLSIVLNILIPTMIEHISVALVFTNIIFVIYSKIKTKKWNKLFLINFILSFSGFLIIYLSPGAKQRASEMAFNSYSLLKKISINIPNFINYTFVVNSFLIVLIFVVLLLFLNNIKMKKYIKIIISIILSVIPFFTALYQLLSKIQINSSKLRFLLSIFEWTQNSNNVIIIFYWIIITILLFVININYILKYNNYKSMFFYLIGIIGNLSMLLSPIWGGRTSLFTIIMLSIDMLILIDSYNIKFNKIIIMLLYCFIFYHFIILFITYYSVFNQQIDREKAIRVGIENNKSVIDIGRFPENLLWNSNAWNEFHEREFKKYYGINDDVILERTIVRYYKNIYYRKK